MGSDDTATCTWRGTMALTQEPPKLLSDWLSLRIALTLEDTDCIDVISASWSGEDPTQWLESADLQLTLSFLDDYQFSHILVQVGEHQEQLYALQLVAPDQVPLSLGYGLSQEMDSSTRLQVGENGAVTMLPIMGELPDGVLRWHSIESHPLTSIADYL